MKIESSLGQIERRIVTAAVVSKQYLDELVGVYDPEYMQSDEARAITRWCFEYHEKYGDAPGKHIADILATKKRAGQNKDAVDMLDDLVESLSDDYDPGKLNIPFVLDETVDYFRKQNLILLGESVQELAQDGENLEAEQLVAEHSFVKRQTSGAITLTAPNKADIRLAFEDHQEPLIKYPGALGRFVNSQLTREALVGVMGPEKAGKTFMLLDMAIRGLRSGSNVAFFEAGDMTEAQLLRRAGINQCGRSDIKRYCNPLLIPALDCYYNLIGKCDLPECKGDDQVFDDMTPREITSMSFADLQKAFKEFPDHIPCYECDKNGKYFKGAMWFRQREEVDPLTWKEAYEAMHRLGKRTKRQFKLYCYPNDTLRVRDIEAELDVLYRSEGWAPDIVVVDYADIMHMEGRDEREKQNTLWKRLRSLSQKRRCLMLTATQADAKSYEQKTLTRSNFSEDKRKYAHVTAMMGIQKTDDEKRKGILRMNMLVVREDYFEESTCVHILQRLEMGKPFLASF